jgi:uncharacterized cupredoxin-like copper-binding protein
MEYQATHVNKCVYYSLFCSDQRKVTDKFKLGLARQVKALAVLTLCNGPDKHHQFFTHLYEQDVLTADTLPSVFAKYCNDSLGGSVMSVNCGKRHQPHWTKPYLKAELLYGLRVLLSIIEDANAGNLSKKDAFTKVLAEVKFAGGLIANHLFAVAVLRGLIIGREFLTQPVVALTLCNAVRKTLFQGGVEFTDERIRKATEKASNHLGVNRMVGEHALCEMVRGAKDKSPGYDCFSQNQDFYWCNDDNGNDQTITEIRNISGRTVRIRRTEADDLNAFEDIPKKERNNVNHRWWLPEPNREDCLLHFVKECARNGGNPMEVLYPSSKVCDKSSTNLETKLWNTYITKKSNKIDIDKLPEILRCHPTSNDNLEKERENIDNQKKGAMGTRMVIKKRMKNVRVGRVSKKRKATLEELTVTRMELLNDKKIDDKRNTTVAPTSKGRHTVKFDLDGDARVAIHNYYGNSRFEIETFGDNYKGLGTVWTCNIKLPDGRSMYTTTDYVPSVLDNLAVLLPNDDGYAFRSVKIAEQALFWWIICTQQTESHRQVWANKLLGDHRSVVLKTTRNDWCTLFLNEQGEYWVEYNGRKRKLA